MDLNYNRHRHRFNEITLSIAAGCAAAGTSAIGLDACKTQIFQFFPLIALILANRWISLISRGSTRIILYIAMFHNLHLHTHLHPLYFQLHVHIFIFIYAHTTCIETTQTHTHTHTRLDFSISTFKRFICTFPLFFNSYTLPKPSSLCANYFSIVSMYCVLMLK